MLGEPCRRLQPEGVVPYLKGRGVPRRGKADRIDQAMQHVAIAIFKFTCSDQTGTPLRVREPTSSTSRRVCQNLSAGSTQSPPGPSHSCLQFAPSGQAPSGAPPAPRARSDRSLPAVVRSFPACAPDPVDLLRRSLSDAHSWRGRAPSLRRRPSGPRFPAQAVSVRAQRRVRLPQPCPAPLQEAAEVEGSSLPKRVLFRYAAPSAPASA